MNLEQQVTSLEISKRLKELGVIQESLFSWQRQYLSRPVYEVRLTSELKKDDERLNTSGLRCSAFTVAELGEMLPLQVEKDGSKYLLQDRIYQKEGVRFFTTNYRNYKIETWLMGFPKESTEANARGRMLIYLLENKLI